MKRTFLASVALALTCSLLLPACDDDKASPDKREDEGGDEPAEEETPSEPDDPSAKDDEAEDTKKVVTPRPTNTQTKKTTKTGDFEETGNFAKTGDGTAKTDDTVKKADDSGDEGSNVVGATPFKSDRGSGSGPGGKCPCLRGFVCCDGICKKSCS